MLDDSPSTYSAVALPSSSRAAPAKKRSWSTPWSTSSVAMCALIWPVSRDCSSTSSSRAASTASAICSSASWRALGVVRLHDFDARRAAAKAASTSSAVEIGDRPSARPVVGSTSSMKSVAAESTRAPST
jgi:hypothetical protein